MLRVLAILAPVSITVAGCALDPAPAGRAGITKVVTRERACTITRRPMTAEEFCEQANRERPRCAQITTCAEAYYRLTVCKHQVLDGGPVQGTYEKPDSRGEPDGIPCEKERCGPNARSMVLKIRAEESRGEQPFSLPMTTSKVCDPT
jgi:hypothetical protein